MHRWFRWLGLGLVVACVVLGVSASAQSNQTPLTIACGNEGHPPDLIPEVRRAAGIAAGIKLDREVRSQFQRLIRLFFAAEEDLEANPPEPITRDELADFDRALSERIADLEWIARGPNAACRQVVEFSGLSNSSIYNALDVGHDVQPANTLASLYVTQALVRAYLTTELQRVGVTELQDAFPSEAFLAEARRVTASAHRAETFELGLSRSILTRLSLLALAVDVFSDAFILEELLNAEKWRNVACGGAETFAEVDVELDGSVEFAHIDGGGHPFRETAAASWFYAQFLRNPFAVLFDPSFADNLYETAMDGCTAELRAAAAEFLFQLADEGHRPQVALEIVNSETSIQFQRAAAPWVALHWAEEADLTPLGLQERALTGESVGIRMASGLALGLVWARKVEQGDLSRSSVVEFLGPYGDTTRSGTLVQFAGAHTETHPELARAAVLPLTLIYLDDAN